MNPGMRFIQNDIIKKAGSSKYDACTLVEVFEHIPLDQCDSFVLALHKIINPGGYLYLTVPHVNKKLEEKHFQHFDEGKLCHYFSGKFEIKKIVFIQKTNIIYTFISKLLHNSVYSINNKVVMNLYYSMYKKYFFFAKDSNCRRIFVTMKRV